MKADDDVPGVQSAQQQFLKEPFRLVGGHGGVKVAVHHRIHAVSPHQSGFFRDGGQHLGGGMPQHGGGGHVKGIGAGDQVLPPGGLRGGGQQGLVAQMHAVEGAQAHGGGGTIRRQILQIDQLHIRASSVS